MPKKSIGVLLAVFIISQTIGFVSAEDWPMYRHDIMRTGVSKSYGPLSVKLLWAYNTGDSVAASPAVVNGRVYIGSFNNFIYCLDAKNGTLVWRFATAGPVVSSSAVVDGKVYVGSHDGSLYCLDATRGTLIWRYETSNWIEASPAVAYGIVYFTGGDGYVYALNAQTGAEIWKFYTGAWSVTPVSISEGRVYAGSSNGYMYCLDAYTGLLYWQYAIGYCMNPAPVVVGDMLYATYAEGGTVLKLAKESQALIWRTVLDSTIYYSSLAVFENWLFVGTDNGYFYCLNASTGNILWRFQSKSSIYSSPAVASNTVYFGSCDYSVYALNIIDGTLRWEFKTTGGIHSSPAICNGILYIGSLDGKVYALTSSTPADPNILIKFEDIATQRAGFEFAVNISVYDSNGNLMSDYSDQGSLEDTTGTITPTSIKFSGGRWNGLVNITKAGLTRIKATLLGCAGTSNEFQVRPGVLDGFYFEPIKLVVNDVPFPITIYAKDKYNNTVTDFNGEVKLTITSGIIKSPSSGVVQFGNGVYKGAVTISDANSPSVIKASYRAGVDFVFAVDNSGSMADDPDGDGISEFENLRAFVRSFISELSPKDRAALYAFGPVPNVWPGETPWLYLNFVNLNPTGKSKFVDTLNALVPEYNTPLWDTIGAGIEYCKKYSIQNSLLIVISDGCDFGADWYARPSPELFPGFAGNGIGFERGSEVYAPWHNYGEWKHYKTHYGEYFVDPLNVENNVAFIEAPIEDLEDWHYGCTYDFAQSENYANGTRNGLLNADILIYTIGIGLPHHTPYLPNTTEYDLYRIATTSNVFLEDGSQEYGRYFHMQSASQLNVAEIVEALPYTSYGLSNQIKVVDKFTIDHINNQFAGTPFAITIYAVDRNENVVNAFENKVSIMDATATLAPTETEDFVGGSWRGVVVITKATAQNQINVYFKGNLKGTSNDFSVSPLEIVRIEVLPDYKIINLQNLLQFTATGYDRYNNPVPLTPLWSVDCGIIDETGLFKPTECGVFTVYATFNGVVGNATVVVVPPVLHKIEVSPQEAIIYTTQTQRFIAKGFDKYGNPVDIAPIWYTSSGSIENGLYTPVCAGRHQVFAEDSGIVGCANITVITIRVEVTADRYKITADETLQCTATAYDGNNNEVPIEPVWSASAGYINGTGFYQPTSTGYVCIAAADTNTGASGWTTIEVVPGRLTTILVYPSIVDVTEGLSTQFIAKGYDAHGNGVDIQPVWSVSGGGSITQTGYFTATQPGMYIVVAAVDEIAGSAIVNVVPVARIEITPRDAVITVGSALQLTATGYGRNNNIVPIRPTWSTNGGGTITQTGLYVATVIGHWKVYAEQSGTIGYANISVVPENGLYQIKVTPSEVTVTTDQTVQFTATGYAGDGKEVAVLPNWAVNGGGYIDENGLFTPTAVGRWLVYANSSGISGNATVLVLPGRIAKIVVKPLNATVTALETVQFSAEGFDKYGNAVELTPTWRADAGLITNTGLYTGISAGRWNVYATQGGVVGCATVVVLPGSLSWIEVTPSYAVVELRCTFEFYATCYDDAGNVLNLSLNWSVEPAGYGEIMNGVFKAGLVVGECTVTASYGCISGSAQIRIVPPTPAVSMECALPPTFDLGLTNEDITVDAVQLTAGATINISAVIHNYADCTIGLWHGNIPTYYNGEWVEYDFYLQSTMLTNIAIKCGDYDSAIPVEVWLDSKLVARFDLPVGWHTVTISNVYIPAGSHTLRINLVYGEVPRDLSIDWLMVADKRIEAENYARHGGSDPNPAYRGVDGIHPSDFIVRVYSFCQQQDLIFEGYVGATNTVNLRGDCYYIQNNGVALLTTTAQFTKSSIYEIYVVTDATGKIAEVNEENNIARITINVTAGALAKLSISPPNATIRASETVQFVATGYDAYDNLVPVNVDWFASAGVIDATGLYKNTKAGVYTVYACVENILASATVTVVPADLAAITITPSNATIVAGQIIKFTAEGFDEFGNEIMISPVWYATNGTIEDGLYTNIYAGTYTIYAVSDGITASVQIEVLPDELAYIVVSPNSATMKAGEAVQFTAVCFDRYANILSLNVSWSATEGTIENGLYTNTRAGVYTVCASFSNITSAATVVVTPNSLTTITILPPDAAMQAGEYLQFHAIGFDEYGNEIVVSPAWQAEGGFIDAAGLYFAIRSGVHTVTARVGNITGYATVTVSAGNLVRIELQPSNAVITADDEMQFTACGYDAFDNEITVSPLWSAENGLISQTGLYTATAVGRWFVSATVQNISATAVVEVEHGRLVKIELQPTDVTLTADETIQFVATGYDADNNDFAITPCWSSTGGIINQTGFYTATTVGRWVVCASLESVTGTATVTVTHGLLARIAVQPEQITITADDTIQFCAIGYDADNNPFAITPAWSATDGIIYQSGLYVATRVGRVQIYATVGDIAGCATVEVEHGRLVCIVVSPAQTIITADETVDFDATGFDEDDNEIEITPQWSATEGFITQTGVYYPTLTGTYEIYAKVPEFNVTGVATVTVKPGICTELHIQPANATLYVGDSLTFHAIAFDAHGNEAAATLKWDATGGVITQTGFYTATSVGNHLVRVTECNTNLTSTASVTVLPVLRYEDYAIWANSTSIPKTIHISGSDNTVRGNTHSNNDIHISGSDNVLYGDTEYVNSFFNGGSDNVFNAVQSMPMEPPLRIDINLYKPAGTYGLVAQSIGKYYYVNGDLHISSSDQLLEGLYYVTGDVHISGSDCTGSFTIISEGNIHISGSDVSQNAFINNISLFAQGSIKISGSGTALQGIVYAERVAELSGSSIAITGFLYGDKVKLTGSDMTITAFARADDVNGNSAPDSENSLPKGDIAISCGYDVLDNEWIDLRLCTQSLSSSTQIQLVVKADDNVVGELYLQSDDSKNAAENIRILVDTKRHYACEINAAVTDGTPVKLPLWLTVKYLDLKAVAYLELNAPDLKSKVLDLTKLLKLMLEASRYVKVEAVNLFDTDGRIVGCEILIENTVYTTSKIVYEYAEDGSYEVKLRLKDDRGGLTEITRTLSVSTDYMRTIYKNADFAVVANPAATITAVDECNNRIVHTNSMLLNTIPNSCAIQGGAAKIYLFASQVNYYKVVAATYQLSLIKKIDDGLLKTLILKNIYGAVSEDAIAIDPTWNKLTVSVESNRKMEVELGIMNTRSNTYLQLHNSFVDITDEFVYEFADENDENSSTFGSPPDNSIGNAVQSDSKNAWRISDTSYPQPQLPSEIHEIPITKVDATLQASLLWSGITLVLCGLLLIVYGMRFQV